MSDGLLDKLKETSAADLSAGVARQEGVPGATLEPIYSRRRFKCFVVTESELQQIGLANLTATATGSLGSGFFAFWLDIYKDSLLTPDLPKEAAYFFTYARPTCFWLAIVFWLLTGSLMVWRHRLVETFKSESIE